MTRPVDASPPVDPHPAAAASTQSSATSATLQAFVARTRSSSAAGTAQTLLIVGDEAASAAVAATIAKDLERELLRVPLSALAWRSTGETLQQLDLILAKLPAGNAVLLFDEADALFGKRTDVKDSHDRHANAVIDSLLQRIEARAGVAIVATRYKPDLDGAFTRRFAAIANVDSPPR